MRRTCIEAFSVLRSRVYCAGYCGSANRMGIARRFICCSATVANPAEHILASDLASASGREPRRRSARAPNNSSCGIPRSSMRPRARGGARTQNRPPCLRAWSRMGCGTLPLPRARKTAELLLYYAREHLKRHAPEYADRVRSYRAGYLPEERRAIEQGLFQGRSARRDGHQRARAGHRHRRPGRDRARGDSRGTIASLWQQARARRPRAG